MEGSEEGADRENRHTHRETINRDFFFLYIIAPSRRPLVEAGGNATRCDLIPDIMSFVSLDLYIKWE